MKILTSLSLLSLCAALSLTGCLTAARKAVTLRVNPDGTGTGTMVYYDIASMQEEETDNSLTDYSRLVETWLHGSVFEQANPALVNVKKRLFAEGNRLNGEISFEFLHYSDIGLYRHRDTGPWMYYALMNQSEIEHFDSTNGEYGGQTMPVIFWPEGTKEFRIFNAFESGERPVVSLYPQYKRLGVEKRSKE